MKERVSATKKGLTKLEAVKTTERQISELKRIIFEMDGISSYGLHVVLTMCYSLICKRITSTSI